MAGNANSGPHWRTNDDLRKIFELYLALGTLEKVGQRMGLTRERVRQLLQRGNQRGVCQYTKNWKVCDRMPQLAEAMKTAESWTMLGRLLGYHTVSGQWSMSKRVCRLLGISLNQQRRFRANRRARLLRQCLGYMEALQTPLFSSAVLERTSRGRSFYNCLIREFGSIYEVRRQLNLPVIHFKHLKRPKGSSGEQQALKELNSWVEHG